MTRDATGLRAMAPQVLIVGAGPVGLLLAGELRLGGAEVTVLERRPARTTESRASTLHARTMELLDSRGLLTGLGDPPSQPVGHFGGIALDLTCPGPYPGQWKVPQSRTEELLEEWALTLGADIRRSHELRELLLGSDHVEAVAESPTGAVRVRADYVVACDGEESSVRTLTGAEFPGHGVRRELLRADVAGIAVSDRRFQRLPDGFAVAARRPDGVTRVMVHEFRSAPRTRSAPPEFQEVVDAWKRVTGEDISMGTPLWVNAFGDAHRQLTHYRAGRVLYAGDAAHQQLPIGGQALNLGLQDATNLGWKLAAHVAGWAPPGLLDSYHSERHAVGRRVLDQIALQAGLLLGPPETAEAQRALLAELIDLDEVRTHLAGMISALDIRYDVSGAAVPEHPLLGVRLPPVPVTVDGEPTGTLNLLDTGRALLLDLGSDPSVRTAVAPWADRVRRVAAVPAGGGDLTQALPRRGAVLVRPDGYVVWAAPKGGEGLEAALNHWFGAPSKSARGAAA